MPYLLREFGYAAQAFSSAEEFLASDYLCQTQASDPRRRHAGDDRARSAMGIDASPEEDTDRLHHRPWRRKRPPTPTEQGAVECLLKPFSDTALREALNAGLGG